MTAKPDWDGRMKAQALADRPAPRATPDHSLGAEPVQEALLNVLQILGVAEQDGGGRRLLTALEYQAIRLRLEQAIRRLNALPVPTLMTAHAP